MITDRPNLTFASAAMLPIRNGYPIRSIAPLESAGQASFISSTIGSSKSEKLLRSALTLLQQVFAQDWTNPTCLARISSGYNSQGV